MGGVGLEVGEELFRNVEQTVQRPYEGRCLVCAREPGGQCVGRCGAEKWAGLRGNQEARVLGGVVLRGELACSIHSLLGPFAHQGWEPHIVCITYIHIVQVFRAC